MSIVPRYSLEAALSKLLKYAGKKRDTIEVLAFAGGSGSGKSKIAEYVSSFVKNSLYFSLDDFFGKPIVRGEIKDFDDPECYNLPKVNLVLKELKEKKEAVKPVYNKKDGSHSKKVVIIGDNGLIIIEGLHTLNDMVRGEVDCGVFVDADNELRLQRRIERDGPSLNMNKRKIIKMWNIAEEVYRTKIASTQHHANLIIENNEHSDMLKLERRIYLK